MGAGIESGIENVLRAAMTAAIEYATSIDDRRVAPDAAALAALAEFDEPLPDVGVDEGQTIRLLHAVGSPATVATTGRRYFGFVNGAAYPVALGSSWLASSWDQNAALPVMSPVAAKLHDVVSGWLVDVLRLPQWNGATAMRISVSSWKTDLRDARFAADVILDCASRVLSSA